MTDPAAPPPPPPPGAPPEPPAATPPPPPPASTTTPPLSSQPLSAPRRSSGPSPMGDPYASVDQVARVQTILAIALGLVLIAIPLYLWRRPRADVPPITSNIVFYDAGALSAEPPRDAAPPPPPPVTLSEAKVMECHDTGSRRTPPTDCDHLEPLEKTFAAAITAAGACLPPGSGGGNLVYVLDASFLRKRHPIELVVPRDGRALKSTHGAAAAVKDCQQAVKNQLAGTGLDGVPHQHGRYKIAITATYPAVPGSP